MTVLYSWARQVPADLAKIETFLAWLFQQGIDFKLAGDYVLFRREADSHRSYQFRFENASTSQFS
jgi:hypothetical protein